MGGFIACFEQTNDPETTSNSAYWYALAVIITTTFMTVIRHPFNLYLVEVTSKVRVACSGLIFRKVLQLTNSMTEDGQNSKIMNLLSNDLVKLGDGFSHLHEIWRGPVEAVMFLFVIYMEIGVGGVIGIAFLLSFTPLQGKVLNLAIK